MDSPPAPVSPTLAGPPADAPTDLPQAPAVEKSYLVQRIARLKFGTYHVVGYSVAGEETVVQVPEMNVCFDVGRAPHFALTSDILCLTHAHMDHVAGVGYYLSQRHFQGMKPGTVLLPREMERPVDNLLRAWRDLERQETPYTLVPMGPNELYEVRRDFGIRTVRTQHGGPSLAYVLISIREKLKPEYLGKSGPELVEMKRSGVEIQYRQEVPIVAFLGDTTAGPVFEHPDVINAEVLVTECTFFEPDHKSKAKFGRHLHVEQFARLLPSLKNKYVLVGHVTRRTGVRRAQRILRKLVGNQQMERVHFLMDFDQSANAGDVEEANPMPPDGGA
ncbi:MAG: putative ribonuclease [Phycisphaerales bacterium]|nr:putative ribonuclease [Phycisphaerales bacterium]